MLLTAGQASNHYVGEARDYEGGIREERKRCLICAEIALSVLEAYPKKNIHKDFVRGTIKTMIEAMQKNGK